MKAHLRVFCVVNLLICAAAIARPVKVILDERKEVIQYHTPALLFGLRYGDGGIIGSGLFTDSDLKAGNSEKMLQLDDSQTIANCEYQWALSTDPIPGPQKDPVLGTVELPSGFDGVVRNKCSVDLERGEIRLTIGPLKLEKLDVVVPADSLANRGAKSLLAFIAPKGDKTDTFKNIDVTVSETTIFPFQMTRYFFIREPMNYDLQTIWVLKAGGTQMDQQTLHQGPIEIR